MNNSFLLIVAVLCVLGCKKNTSEIKTDTPKEVVLDSLSTEIVKMDLLPLSTEAEKSISSFDDFKNLRNLLKTMRSSNPFHIKKYADSTDLLIQSFNENLDEGGGDMNTNSIKSRIIVLATESGLLMELASKKNPIPQSLLNSNIRLLTAYNSLVIQLNELSLAIPENIEKELLRDTELRRDSITDPNEKLE